MLGASQGCRGPEAARSCPALAAAHGSPQRSAPPAAPITYGIMAVIESVTVILCDSLWFPNSQSLSDRQCRMGLLSFGMHEPLNLNWYGHGYV